MIKLNKIALIMTIVGILGMLVICMIDIFSKSILGGIIVLLPIIGILCFFVRVLMDRSVK